MVIIVRKPTPEEISATDSWHTWTNEVSTFDWSYDEKETCLILKGKATVTGKKGKKISFGSGDFVIFPQGIECTWQITEPICKKYTFGE